MTRLNMRSQRLILILGLLLTISINYTSTVQAQTSHSVTFWEHGVGNDYTGTVATIAGGNYNVVDIGTCYTIKQTTDITFSYHSPLIVDSTKQYVWDGTTSDTIPPITTQEGTVPVAVSGNVYGNYLTQYFVAFSTNPSSAGTTTPSGTSNWINAGTIHISATPTPGFAFSSWEVTGLITINNPNSATTTATINGAGTIKANFQSISSLPTYSLSPFVTGHGSINPSVPVSVTQGNDKTFTFTPDTGYQINEVLVDSQPVVTSNSYTFTNVRADHKINVTFSNVPPALVAVRIDSNPSGETHVKVDGIPITTPQTFTWSPGSIHKLEAPSQEDGATGIRYAFTSWSNGGAITQDYTVSNSTSVVASYKTQYLLSTNANFGTITPESGTWYDQGTKITVKAQAPSVVDGESYVFSGWKGSLDGYTGSNNPSAEFTMNIPVTEEATWQHIFQFKVNSAYGSTQGAGWYEPGHVVLARINATTINIDSGTRAIFTGWSGDASGTGTDSNSLVINGPRTATAVWKTQHQITFSESGLKNGILGVIDGVVVTVNGVPLRVNELPYTTGWIDSGNTIEYAFSDTATSSFGGKYKISNVNGPASPLTVENSVTVSADYNFQTIVPTLNNLALLLILVIAIALIIVYIRKTKKNQASS